VAIDLVRGIASGFAADVLIRLSTKCQGRLQVWLQTMAVRRILAMYAIGHGVDDGADVLLEQLGLPAKAPLQRIASSTTGNPMHRSYAQILLESHSTLR
jgi:hypothetical protein